MEHLVVVPAPIYREEGPDACRGGEVTHVQVARCGQLTGGRMGQVSRIGWVTRRVSGGMRRGASWRERIVMDYVSCFGTVQCGKAQSGPWAVTREDSLPACVVGPG
jgi:hypothetical protein